MDKFLEGLGSFLSGTWVYFIAVVALFVFFKIWTSLRVIVPTNEAHIVQSRTKTTSYGKGKKANTYMRWPDWVPWFGVTRVVLPVNNFSVDLKSYEAYDKDRVPFALDVTAFFRIADTDTAAERVSDFSSLKSELNKILQGAIRHVLQSRDIHEIMGERATFGEQFTAEVLNELKSWGVETVKAIELMDIHDVSGSNVIKDIQAMKISEIDSNSRTTVAQNNRIAELAEIEAQQAIDVRKQEAELLVGQKTADKDMAVGIANEKAKQSIQVEAATTAQRQMEVLSIETQRKAEIEKEAAIVKAEADRDTTIVRAEGEKRTAIVKAEGEKEKTILVAQGNRDQSVLTAEGVRAEGEARARAEEAMQLASVTAQTTLANSIGTNKDYQDYMIRQRTVEANEAIGIAQAEALGKGLENADIKVIANGSSAQDGISSLSGLMSSKGGVQAGAMFEGFMSTEAGQKVVAAVVEKVANANGAAN